ncbi:hypothetical protein DD584_16700 [Klebsiella pneumoniae]|nr:hypothetical protein DD584_16700 [Klebsiella pneumoniae]
MFTGHDDSDSGSCSCSGKAHHGITGPGCGENDAPRKRTHHLQQEDRLLRAEEQGIIDQGARTAIHIREQEVQREIRELR